jgi:hypothetical protein
MSKREQMLGKLASAVNMIRFDIGSGIPLDRTIYKYAGYPGLQ